MLDQRNQAKATKADLLEKIEMETAAEQLRQSVAEADEAENRARKRDRLENAAIEESAARHRESKERISETRHRKVRGWVVAVAAIVLTALWGIRKPRRSSRSTRGPAWLARPPRRRFDSR